MLSIKTLTSAAQAASYYERDDYYAKEVRSPSLWWGKTASSLGLSGTVDRSTFRDLLEGILPNGEVLPRRGDAKRRVAYDLTFSAPKSVSLMALVGGDERILRAHETAVSTALRYL